MSGSTPRPRWDVVVIGGGAAGLFAATAAASHGKTTLLLEKNVQTGVKILMSGGTRCNITHECTWREMADGFGTSAGRFLKTALASLTPQMVVDIIEREGVPTKVESTGKVFPVSDRAIDVRDALQRRAVRAGVQIRFGASVREIHKESDEFVCSLQVRSNEGTSSRQNHESGEEEPIRSANLIVTCGGQSYPGCGTCGDGYAWAQALGHTIVTLKPALTPLISEVPWVRELRGISVDDIQLSLREPAQHDPLAVQHAPLLFTHFGLSGPGPMNLSRDVPTICREPRPYLDIDWVRSLDEAELRGQLGRRRAEWGKRPVAASPAIEMPMRLWAAVCLQAGIDDTTRWAELNRESERRLSHSLKHTAIPLHGTMGYRKAEVTAGGVALEEINSRTMESRLVPGLFFAGEILDVDGPIGGYNFQAAFSSGSLAGEAASGMIK